MNKKTFRVYFQDAYGYNQKLFEAPSFKELAEYLTEQDWAQTVWKVEEVEE